MGARQGDTETDEEQLLDDEPSPEMARAKACASSIHGECSFLEPDRHELQEMARCGAVRTDAPSGLLNDGEPTLSASMIDQANVSAREGAEIRSAIISLRAETQSKLRGSFSQLRVPVPEDASIQDMIRLMRTKLPEGEFEAAQRQVAQERAAGRVEEARTPAETIVRTSLALGDTLEEELARRLGEERAHELRLAGDGWETKMVAALACEEE